MSSYLQVNLTRTPSPVTKQWEFSRNPYGPSSCSWTSVFVQADLPALLQDIVVRLISLIRGHFHAIDVDLEQARTRTRFSIRGKTPRNVLNAVLDLSWKCLYSRCWSYLRSHSIS